MNPFISYCYVGESPDVHWVSGHKHSFLKEALNMPYCFAINLAVESSQNGWYRSEKYLALFFPQRSWVLLSSTKGYCFSGISNKADPSLSHTSWVCIQSLRGPPPVQVACLCQPLDNCLQEVLIDIGKELFQYMTSLWDYARSFLFNVCKTGEESG